MTIEFDVFATTTIAMCVFFLGYAITMRSGTLQKFSIPESVVGGFICAVLIAVFFAATDIKILFDLERRDTLLIYFFAALGLRSSPKEIFTFRRPIFILVLLASVFILVQNSIGIAVAQAFELPPQSGIVAGSIALIGRSGTTVAWAPLFQQEFGVEHASRLGLATNMAGLIAACAIGSPIARFLIQRHKLGQTSAARENVDVGFYRDPEAARINYQDFLLALLRIHIAIVVAQIAVLGLEQVGIQAPLYIVCLIAGIAIGNVKPPIAPGLDWSGSDQGLTFISYISLGLFYTMTFMNLQLWTAGSYLTFILVVIFLQVLATTAFIVFVVFRVMGRDYEAAVMSAGFAGMALGSTATAMAMMAAVSKQFGGAHKAIMVVSLTCGVFMDIINSVAISLLARAF